MWKKNLRKYLHGAETFLWTLQSKPLLSVQSFTAIQPQQVKEIVQLKFYSSSETVVSGFLVPFRSVHCNSSRDHSTGSVEPCVNSDGLWHLRLGNTIITLELAAYNAWTGLETLKRLLVEKKQSSDLNAKRVLASSRQLPQGCWLENNGEWNNHSWISRGSRLCAVVPMGGRATSYSPDESLHGRSILNKKTTVATFPRSKAATRAQW